MKVRRVLALVMAVLMVIGLMPVVAAGDVTPPMTDAEGKVTFTKDFVRDDNNNPVVDDGYYTIKISVSGKPYTVETTPNADVILVVDNSGSMATSVGDKCTNTVGEYKEVGRFLFWSKWKCDTCGSIYYKGLTWDERPDSCTGEIGAVPRINAARNVGKVFANSILSTSGNKMAVVGFSHNSEDGGVDNDAVHVYQSLTTDSSIITKKIDDMNADGGTNYTAAFEKAKNELLGSDGKLKDANRPAYVIFISDGAPGFSGESLDKSAWNGSAQITALKNAGVKIYTIGIKLDEGASNYMRGIATDTDHYKNVQTTDYESEMKSILAEWAKHINSVPAGKKAKVVDVVNTNDFDVNVDDLPKNAKYEDSTITWEFDEITEDAQCISFKVKPKEELDTGDYNTNGDCVLNYVDGKTNQEINPALTADSPSIHVDKEETTFTVTFDLNGGVDADSACVDQTIPNGGNASKPATDPTKEGFTFNGWYAPGAETVFDFENTSITADITLTARWIEDEPEIDPPTEYEFPMVKVKCTTDGAGHQEEYYVISAGDYTPRNNGNVINDNGTYKYEIELKLDNYLNKYNADVAVGHTLAEGNNAIVTIVNDGLKWTSSNVTVNVNCKTEPETPHYSAEIVSINLLSATAEKPFDGKPLTKDEFESLKIEVRFTNINDPNNTYDRSYDLKNVTITPVDGQDRTYRISLKLDDNRLWQIDVKFTDSQTQVGVSDNAYRIVGFSEIDDSISGALDGLKEITKLNYGKLTVTAKDDPIDPPFIVIFPTLEISNKVIAPKNFEKTSFEYDIINVKTGDVEKSVTLKADSSVRVMVTGGTEYMVVPKNLEVPGYIVTTTSTPDSATVTSDKIGNVSVDFTHIYVVGLNTEDHYAYIRGYEDGTIRPEGNITRAEVATIFYRLLSSEALAAFKTTENTFTDVDSDAWYNLSVSTLAKAGVISGYPDGSFNPNGKITRAELVSIATRFFTTIEVGDSKFEDIGGHWAAKAIDEAYIKGIIKGYSDGTFRPDQAVTRAEAMKIVNGILGRPIDTCVLIEGIKLWPDVASDAWYYYVVAEATNAHRYELTTPEKWTAIIINEIEY